MTVEDDLAEPRTSAEPTPKVAAAGVAGAFVTLLVFIAAVFGLEMPPEVAAALVTVLAFAAAYMRRD